MKKALFLLLSALALVVHAQLPPASLPASAAMADVERTRINAERASLEAGFVTEEIACYKKFLVNRCLDEIKPRRRDAMADLRRQEVLLDDQDRKAKAARQILKTEEKSSVEKQQEAADRRATSLKDFDTRMERDAQKKADRDAAKSSEKSNADSAAGRVTSNQQKASDRSAKQAESAEEVRKFNERQEKAKERQARYERDKAARTGPPAKTLPQPQ
ncbi:MAG: hypothetical protein V4718_12045 [Pseudomonadota bacterium]